MNSSRLSLRGIAIVLGLLLVLLLVFLLQNRQKTPVTAPVGGGNNGGIAQPVSGSATVTDSASATAALPGKVKESDLAAAKGVAERYVTVVNAVDYRTIQTEPWLATAKPLMTPAYYQRAKSRQPSTPSADDLQFYNQLKASRTVVSVHVTSSAVASGDGGAVSGGRFQMRVYYILTTDTQDNGGGVHGPEIPATLNMLKIGGQWLVDGANGA